MDEYLHAYLHYEERFKLLIDILHHEDTAKFFPPFVVRKQGKLGLIDYYLQVQGVSRISEALLRGTDGCERRVQGSRGHSCFVQDREKEYFYAATRASVNERESVPQEIR